MEPFSVKKWLHRKVVPVSLKKPKRTMQDNKKLNKLKKTYPENRKIYIDNRAPEDFVHLKYCDNEIVSSKYTIWNFLFKNLFEQLYRIANFYFLCIAIIELLIDSPVSPITSILPLVFVVSVTGIKQGYEDFLRHKADRAVNSRKVLVMRGQHMKMLTSREIRVGDLVRVKSDDPIPCDMVLLSTSNRNGLCFITTANLDGETNLKRFTSLAETRAFDTCESLNRLRAYVECEQPTEKLYQFVGLLNVISIVDGGATTVKPLNADNLLLRGSRLKNTDYIYGCAIYTGQDTKISKNHKTGKAKFSKIEMRMNKFLLAYLCFLILYSVIMYTVKYFYYRRESKLFENTWYLPEPEPEVNIGELLDGILSFMILSNYIIPISLYVTLELQKFIGSKFFQWDKQMYDPVTNECAMALTSDLNEELGQVEYLFTDKTGTLTENEMKFRCCSVGGVLYKESQGDLRKIGGSETIADLNDDELRHMLRSLTLCHTVNVEMLKNKPNTSDNIEVEEVHDNDAFELDETDAVRFDVAPFDETGLSYDYQAQSPDEKSLVEACRRFGVIFHGTTADKIMTLTLNGEQITFELCHLLDFDADRKCMSVIVRHMNSGKYELICKGADTVILKKVISGWNVTNAQLQLDGYAKSGLRTLVIGQRWLTDEEYHQFDDVLNRAKESLEDRASMISKAYAEVENGLNLQGITGIEDLLQTHVPETLVALRKAGIQIWVLTGDKEETAINISYSAGHFDEGMILIKVTKLTSKEKCIEKLRQIETKMIEFTEKRYALIIDGQSLLHLMDRREYEDVDGGDISTFLLASVCKQAETVLGCRMSPLQKAYLVVMIKKSHGNPTTAAIGDGANDVSMIQSADLGLAITGKEGRQAVRSSDYAFARFHFLRRALLLHGHFYYQRTAILVQYFFYKNVAMITAQIYFAIFSGFSAQSIFDGFLLMFYNITFTSLPILAYGLFEQHISADKLLADPSLYRRNRKNALLSGTEFMKWTCLGIWHSLVFSYGVYFIYKSDVVSSDGAAMGIMEYGTIIYTSCIITVNVKLMLHCRYLNIYIICAFFISIFLYFTMTFAYTSVVWGDLELLESYAEYTQLPLYGSLRRIFTSGSTYISLVLLTFAALLPDVVIEIVESLKVELADRRSNSSQGSQISSSNTELDCESSDSQGSPSKFKISFTKNSGKLTFLQNHVSS